MKKSILNLKGFTELSKSQKKEVNGGKLSLSGSTDPIEACCCYGIECTDEINKICTILLTSICPIIN